MDKTFSYSKVYVVCGLLSVMMSLIAVVGLMKEGNVLLGVFFLLCLCLFLWAAYKTALKIIITDEGIRQVFFNHN